MPHPNSGPLLMLPPSSRVLLRILIVAGWVGLAFQTGTAQDVRTVRQSTQPLEIGQTLPEFQLNDFRGTPVDSRRWKSLPVAVVFFGVECPIVQLSCGRLEEYQRKWQDEIAVVGVDANRQDSLQDMAEFAKRTGVTFPLLKDVGNRVADRFGAQRTPEVFLFDRAGKLCYRGAIDDQFTYGQQKDAPDQEYLKDAIEAALAGRPPQTPLVESSGCIIGRVMEPKADSPITYSRQVSRLLNAHCVSCHREGEVAPFALTDYEEVVGWAAMIAEVTAERRMPPWHANPKHGSFANDTSLSTEQIQMLQTWVDAGAPKGDPADLPPPPEFVTGWRIGQPDVEIQITDQPVPIPATGQVPYRYFKVDPGFKEDKWIQAAECRIGNRKVVHHIVVLVDEADTDATHGQIDSEFITATAPGALPLQLEDGFAKLIPAGAKLVFQMHYTPCGTPQEDLSSVGLKFADPDLVRKSVGTRAAQNPKIKIPPREANHEERATFRFKQDSLMLSMFPHMHLRGKSFRYTVRYPDQTTEVLLDVPHYDFNWQNGYQFPEPKLIPAGTVLECVAHYDNSEGNFANPDPERLVRWGDQTTDEMMIGYFDMALADQDLTQPASDEPGPRAKAVLDRLQAGTSVLDLPLRRQARQALDGDRHMRQFGKTLSERIGSLDRVCLTVVDGDDLIVQRVVQQPEFANKLGDVGVSTPAASTRLAEIARGSRPESLGRLDQESTSDLQFMAVAMRSSFHVPITFDGRPATINFWSAEAHAFPELIESQLVTLAELMAER